MSPSFDFKVITPKGVAYEGQVVHALLPGDNGFVGVLANHAPYITSSSGGRLELREKDGSEKKFHVTEGFFEVAHNRATFFTQNLS